VAGASPIALLADKTAECFYFCPEHFLRVGLFVLNTCTFVCAVYHFVKYKRRLWVLIFSIAACAPLRHHYTLLCVGANWLTFGSLRVILFVGFGNLGDVFLN
jgi:hypothetical protein